VKRSLLALSFAALASAALAPPANAVTSVDLSCESGGSLYYCFAHHDAVAPATIRWYVNGSLVSSLNDRTFTGQRTCPRGAVIDIQVVVTDATGSATGSGGPQCHGGPWP